MFFKDFKYYFFILLPRIIVHHKIYNKLYCEQNLMMFTPPCSNGNILASPLTDGVARLGDGVDYIPFLDFTTLTAYWFLRI